MIKTPRSFAVIVHKASSGVDVVFAGGLDHAAAELLAARLGGIGCRAHAEPQRPGDTPGLQRRALAGWGNPK